MSDTQNQDAADILSDFENRKAPETSPPPAPEMPPACEIDRTGSETRAPEPVAEQPEAESAQEGQSEESGHERDVVFIGVKPIMTYVTATLTQLASQPVVTIKARGKRITQAVDVSQMIVKRMNAVGFLIGDVRIASDSLMSRDGKPRKVSTIEIDITKKK